MFIYNYTVEFLHISVRKLIDLTIVVISTYYILGCFIGSFLFISLFLPRNNMKKIIKQKTVLHVDNHDLVPHKSNDVKHSKLLPSTIRSIIAGPSNCGKTNVMLSLLQHPNGLKFQNVYLYSKSLYQPKYVYLAKLLRPIKNLGYYAFSNSETIIPPIKAKPHSVFIFDDVACDKQDVIREYFSMGRHNNIDCFYLCQTYARIPKHLIRDNANVLILFKQDDLNLHHIYADHVGTDMSFDNFKNLCSYCWRKPFGFLSIFKDNNINDGRYRHCFDKYIYI